MAKKIRALFYRYITLGADENTSYNDLKKIQLLHIYCNTWHLFTIFSFIEDFFGNQLMLVSYPIMLSLVISIQVLLYYKRLFQASIVFVTGLFSVSLFFSNYVYVEELLEYYFLLVPTIALIFIDDKRIMISILVLSLLGLYLPNYYFGHYPISVLNNMNPPFLFFSVFIVISYFKNLNIRNEKILESKTKELEELDQFKSQFFTNISHEIRTPLTLINGSVLELDQLKNNDIHAVQSIQRKIKKQSNVITGMVDNVLDLAKMQSSNFSLQLKPTNISELLRKQYLNFHPLFEQKGFDFSISENTEDYIAKIDTVFFERAINNTIVNALKYTDAGSVSITLSKQEKLLHIDVSDTGIGIATNELHNVFKQFYQVNNDINKSGGSGVGLAFSKEIIELHGGQLLLESEVNKGSTFTIVIPLEKTQPTSSTQKTVTLNPKVENNTDALQESFDSEFLIVEDNYDMRKYLVSILKDHRCIEVSNGVEALEVLKEKSVDFIVTDYMMPKMNGKEFVKTLKKTGDDTPVIMLTAKTGMDTKLDMLQLGIDDYLTKPFDKEELLARIDNCIKNYTTRNTYNKEQNIQVDVHDDDFIEQLKQYVCKNSKDITLNQDILAEAFNISKSSFYRKVKSQTGLSPNNFIKEVRLQKARGILEKEPSILLKQLALEVGFNHKTYFSKIYVERFGVRPTKKILI